MTVPMWVLRQLIYPEGGRRLPPMPVFEGAEKKLIYSRPDNHGYYYSRKDVCPGCSLNVTSGVQYFKQATWWHGECWDKKQAAIDAKVKFFQKGTPIVEATKVEAIVPKGTQSYSVPKGNLPNAEYRFWIGVTLPVSQYAQCKCCGRKVVGAAERVAHMEDKENFTLPGVACTVRLVFAYKALLEKKQCVVCRSSVYPSQQKWGVPLCSNLCTTEWMFRQEAQWPLLRFFLRKHEREWLATLNGNIPEGSVNPNLMAAFGVGDLL